MIALVFLTIFALGRATQTVPTPGQCLWTDEVTEMQDDTEVVAAAATCTYTPLSETSTQCTDAIRHCAMLDEENCETRLSADAHHCAWAPVSEVQGICVTNPVDVCATFDCLSEEMGLTVLRASECEDRSDQNSCENGVFTYDQAFADNLLHEVMGYYVAFDNFKECFDNTEDADGNPTNWGTWTRNTELDGERWHICNQNRALLDSRTGQVDYSPCAENTIDTHVVCYGDDSCKEATLKHTALCLGDDSCKDAKFKPQDKTEIIVCSGESSCEDATGNERKDLADDDDTFGYFCGGQEEAVIDQRDSCRGMTIKDNTLCTSETSCEDADIDAKTVRCVDARSGGDSKVCKDATIKVETISCETTDSCDEAVITGNDVECQVAGACIDAQIKLGKAMGKNLGEPRVECYQNNTDNTGHIDFVAGTGPCYGATFTYVLPLLEGDESVRCKGEYSCEEATIKAEAHCVDKNSCKGAYVAKDTICGAGACEDTHFTRGTICCGPGCFPVAAADGVEASSGANTKDEFMVTYEDAGDGGCDIEVKSMKTHPTHTDYVCKRCGKETLIGWITDNKTNLIIALVVTILVFLMIVAGLVFALKKAGLLNGCKGSNDEEVEPEE